MLCYAILWFHHSIVNWESRTKRKWKIMYYLPKVPSNPVQTYNLKTIVTTLTHTFGCTITPPIPFPHLRIALIPNNIPTATNTSHIPSKLSCPHPPHPKRHSPDGRHRNSSATIWSTHWQPCEIECYQGWQFHLTSVILRVPEVNYTAGWWI